MDNLRQRIKDKRADGFSLFDANHIVRQEIALDALEAAKTIGDIKSIVRDLILNTRYKNGVSG